MGISVENDCNIYVADAQTGTVKLIVDTLPIATFCQNLGMLYSAFGVHKKGTKLERPSIEDGLVKMSIVKNYLFGITHEVQKYLGKRNTNGPNGREMVPFVPRHYKVLRCLNLQ